MDSSHIVGLVIAAITLVTTIGFAGALFSMGRGAKGE